LWVRRPKLYGPVQGGFVMGKILNVRISDDLAERLEGLSTKTRRPKGFYVKELLEEHLAEYEDRYLALERLNDKNAKYYTTDQVEEVLGLSSEMARKSGRGSKGR
jgi:RHH-type rel operon transcriptional repressor/antitoxin RelB